MIPHMVGIRKSGRRFSRRGRFAKNWAARCSCGWRGPGHVGHAAWDRARLDVLQHLEETR